MDTMTESDSRLNGTTVSQNSHRLNGPPVEPKLANGHANGLPEADKSAVTSEQSVLDLGFELDDLYKLALRFYKDYELKAFAPSYQDRNKLAALSLQAKHGPIAGEKEPQLGVLDFVGRDRKQEWQALGSMSRQESMQQFIRMLSDVCPLFLPFVQAHAKERQERRQRQELESQRREQLEDQQQELQRFTSQKKAVQQVLNQQTLSQFLAYAEQQYPADQEKQQHLIHQLQEQHYEQYMQQMLQLQQQTPVTPLTTSHTATDLPAESPLLPTSSDNHSYQTMGRTDGDHQDEDSDVPADSSGIEAAKMWTRQDIDAFKESIRKEGTEGMIRVNHGEVVTIKVPTHADGSRIFWEFCTDSYDIGFGVFFEWSESPGNQVSVHVSDSEEEDEDDDEDDESADRDPEKVLSSPESSHQVVIPLFRRDSHEDVFVGSHTYPGRGAYHLKFDNTFSLWRSKTVYYRVYYTR